VEEVEELEFDGLHGLNVLLVVLKMQLTGCDCEVA